MHALDCPTVRLLIRENIMYPAVIPKGPDLEFFDGIGWQKRLGESC
jgi:hypothetical protein